MSPFAHQVSLKFCNSTEDLEDESSSRCGCIDWISDAFRTYFLILESKVTVSIKCESERSRRLSRQITKTSPSLRNSIAAESPGRSALVQLIESRDGISLVGKVKGEGRKFLACTRANIGTSMVIQFYKICWRVEVFIEKSRDCLAWKVLLAKHFEALETHVHWVIGPIL